MNDNQNLQGEYSLNATSVNLNSRVSTGQAVVNIQSESGDNQGLVNIGADNQIGIAAGSARVSLNSNEESIVLNAGSSGTLSAVCGDSSFRQGIEICNEDKSTKIENGKSEGSSQFVKMDGSDLTISNGGLSTSPTITMTSDSIKLSVGSSSSIEISADGITISGLNVTIEGSVNVGVSGAEVDVEASAQATLKGALVMIN